VELENRSRDREDFGKKGVPSREPRDRHRFNPIPPKSNIEKKHTKPGALFSVNRLSDAEAQFGLSCVRLIGRAMVWKSRTN
jgi:hypothetical protein